MDLILPNRVSLIATALLAAVIGLGSGEAAVAILMLRWDPPANQMSPEEPSPADVRLLRRLEHRALRPAIADAGRPYPELRASVLACPEIRIRTLRQEDAGSLSSTVLITATVQDAGFPFRSARLSSSSLIDISAMPTVILAQSPSRPRRTIPVPWYGDLHIYDERLWWGVLGNGLIAWGTLLLILGVPRWVRLVFRTRRNRCPACGYENAGLHACPECGRPRKGPSPA